MKRSSSRCENRFQAHFSRYFIERTCESAKFLISLSILLRNNQHRSIMSPFLLGVSLSLQDRALGGAYTFAHGEASGFSFFIGHVLVRRIITAEAAQCSCPIAPTAIIPLKPDYSTSGGQRHTPTVGFIPKSLFFLGLFQGYPTKCPRVSGILSPKRKSWRKDVGMPISVSLNRSNLS